MPYVNIKITKEGNVTPEQKRQLIEGATKLLADALHKNTKTLVVTIDEVDMDNWGIGGVPRPKRKRKKKWPKPPKRKRKQKRKPKRLPLKLLKLPPGKKPRLKSRKEKLQRKKRKARKNSPENRNRLPHGRRFLYPHTP